MKKTNLSVAAFSTLILLSVLVSTGYYYPRARPVVVVTPPPATEPQAEKEVKVVKEKEVQDKANTVQIPVLLHTIDGKIFNFNAYRGKAIVMDFWATWCPPCRQEIPHFIELQKQYANKDVQIIGIATDADVEAVRQFQVAHGMNYPIVMYDPVAFKYFGEIKSIPTTYFIDRSLRVNSFAVGYRDKTQIEKQIKLLLAIPK